MSEYEFSLLTTSLKVDLPCRTIVQPPRRSIHHGSVVSSAEAIRKVTECAPKYAHTWRWIAWTRMSHDKNPRTLPCLRREHACQKGRAPVLADEKARSSTARKASTKP